jgi:hypothetical protein
MDVARIMSTVAGALALALAAITAHAHGPGADARYRVDELRAPASTQQSCLPAYGSNHYSNSFNDLGVVLGAFDCVTAVDAGVPTYSQNAGPYLTSLWFGPLDLGIAGPCCAFAYNINNSGKVFGAEQLGAGGFAGAIWSLTGGHERIFDDEGCDTIRFAAAVDGNRRYTVGWGLRKIEGGAIPYDTLCLTTRWVIRGPSGVETQGPINGTPYAVNGFDLAVGQADRGAISYRLSSGEVRVLHAADDAHSAEASRVNDLGEIAGRITQNSTPGTYNQCDASVVVRWNRDGRETTLPHLPGAISSRVFGIGYDGETIGDSGGGAYCPYLDYRREMDRAVLWRGTRVIDLNTLIPRSAGITLTVAASINRWGQIATSGWVDSEPLTTCLQYVYDTSGAVLTPFPCHKVHSFLLTPASR